MRFIPRIVILLSLAVACGWVSSAKADPWDKTFPGVVHDAQNIKGFVVEYRWLSNFYPCRVEYEGLVYQSSEAAYQSAKLPLKDRKIFTTLDPDAAKKLAHSSKFDEAAWNARKDRVMKEVVRAKFSQNPELKQKLLGTGQKYLEETNWWNDQYWGVFQGKGDNVLGKTLMAVRTQLGSSHEEAERR